MSRLCLVLLALVAAMPHGRAFIPLTMEPTFGAAVGLVKKWDLASLPDGRIPYWINLNRPPGATPVGPDAPTDVVIQHIQNAFQTWENVTYARVRFRYMGLTTLTNGFDGFNVVTFSPQGINFNPGQPVLPACWYAATAGFYRTDTGTTVSARFPGQVLDFDAVINPRQQGVYTVSDDGNLRPGQEFDLQGYLVHEIGHALGLDHTNTGLDATMNMNVTPRGGFPFRNLSTDDVIGISALYPQPEFLESRGSIGGTVRRPDGRSVFGAHVVAMDDQTGAIVTSTASGLTELYPDGTPKRLSVGVGDYRLVGLPPGTYRLYAEPLDGPNSHPLLNGVFWSLDFQRQLMEIDFTPAFLAGTITVGAQQLLGNVDITVGTRSPAAPNLGIYPFLAQGTGQPFIAAAPARPGTEPLLSVPPGVNLLTSAGLAPETRFDFPAPGVTIRQVLPRPGIDILLYLRIAPDAPFGPRLLQATTRDGIAFMSGGLIIAPPAPLIRSVTASTSSGSTTALIEGENFAGASLPIVHVNGRMAAGLTVESATRLRATVPPGIAGAAEIRVITLTGVARAQADLSPGP